MGFRRVPGDPFAGSAGDRGEEQPWSGADRGPTHPAIEETEFPAIDVFETPGEVVIEAELPGVEPASIGVKAVEGLIVIEGVKEEEPGPGRVNFLCMERTYGAFRRAVLPGPAVDTTRATACCADGVLQVRVPKVEEKRGRVRVIPVTAARGKEGSER